MNITYYKTIIDLKNSLSKCLLLVAGVTDNKRLSKIIVSGQASRYLLAFFVPRNRLTSQVSDNQSIKYLPPFIGVNRHIMADLPANYDGMTLQNKTAFRRICRAVTNDTESKSHHPMTFHSVVLTQKQSLGVAING